MHIIGASVCDFRSPRQTSLAVAIAISVEGWLAGLKIPFVSVLGILGMDRKAIGSSLKFWVYVQNTRGCVSSSIFSSGPFCFFNTVFSPSSFVWSDILNPFIHHLIHALCLDAMQRVRIPDHLFW